MNYHPYSHCHRCGSQYDSDNWPRKCVNDDCHLMLWRPINPVAVLIQPVLNTDTSAIGVILGRRGIEPHRGVFALPGGFVEFGETAEDAVAREIMEEMWIKTCGHPVFSHSFTDTAGHFLLFFVERILRLSDVQEMYRATDECLEMRIAYEPEPLAFQSHTDALARYFTESVHPDQQGGQGPIQRHAPLRGH